MAIRELTSQEIADLVQTRHGTTGFEYPANGLQPYYEWLVRSLHLLGEASAAALRVDRDDANETTVTIAPGRAALDDVVMDYGGGTMDLAVYNNDTAYLWLFDNAGAATIGAGAAASGWPTSTHLKLAEVTLAAGQITAVVDRRFEAMLTAGVTNVLADALTTYSLVLTTAGDTTTPSTVTIQRRNLRGQATAPSDYLRVRVCDSGGYANATNATIAAGANTTVVESPTAGKDVILQGHTDGSFTLDVTDAVAETVTLRIGPASVGAARGDYRPTLNVTHA